MDGPCVGETGNVVGSGGLDAKFLGNQGTLTPV